MLIFSKYNFKEKRLSAFPRFAAFLPSFFRIFPIHPMKKAKHITFLFAFSGIIIYNGSKYMERIEEIIMERLNIGQAQKYTSPNPFALVSTCTADGKNNLMALSWWTYLSNHPATIGVCLSKRGYSGSLIAAQGEFCLCIPDRSLRDAALRCGTCSGRDHDKAAEFGIALEPAEHVRPMRVSSSRLVLECRLQQQIEVADHILYVAEVAGSYGNAESSGLFAMEGYKRLNSVYEAVE